MWANFQRIIELFTKEIVKKLFKIRSWDPGSGIRDLGSGIRKNPIPDPGSRGQKGTDPGSRIRIRNTAYKSVCSLSSKIDHVGVTTMKRLDQGHLHPKLEVPRLTFPAGGRHGEWQAL
jgi:hypothetical protein